MAVDPPLLEAALAWEGVVAGVDEPKPDVVAQPGRRDAGTGSRGLEDRGIPAEAPETPPANAPFRQQLPAVNVWSYRIGKFIPDGEWQHTLKISTFNDLAAQLEAAKFHRRVSKLVIVAHGDAAGLVQMERNVTPDNVMSYADDFRKLSTFLTPNGFLLFEACQAGLGERGSLLLTKISSFLQPTQTVVGFTVNGVWAGESMTGPAGGIYEAPESMPGMPARVFKGAPRMTEDSIYTKWARNGLIIRLPLPEEFAAMRGAWTVIAVTANARSAGQLRDATLTITLDAVTLAKGRKSIWSGSYTMDFTYRTEVANKPRTIDINFTAGKDKGKTAFGIIGFGRADFNALSLCLEEPVKPRPDTFAVPPKSTRVLLEMKRAASPKNAAPNKR